LVELDYIIFNITQSVNTFENKANQLMTVKEGLSQILIYIDLAIENN